MAWIRRHALLLAAAVALLGAGTWLAFAEHNAGIGWMLIVWAAALVAGCATPPDRRARRGRRERSPQAPPTARRGRSGSRSA